MSNLLSFVKEHPAISLLIVVTALFLPLILEIFDAVLRIRAVMGR